MPFRLPRWRQPTVPSSLAAAARAELNRLEIRRVHEPREFVDAWPVLGHWGTGLLIALATVSASVILGNFVPLGPIDRESVSWVWQVQAGLLGLAIAVSLFAFRALGVSRGSRRRIIAYTGFPASIVIGLALALLTGIGLYGSHFPFGPWVSVAAIGLTGGWIALLLVTFGDLPRTQDQRYAQRLVAHLLKRKVYRSVTSLLRSRVGVGILRAHLQAVGGDFSLGTASGPEQTVMAHSVGRVTDVDVRRMSALAQRAAAAGGRLETGVRLGDRVGLNTVLCVSSQPIEDGVRTGVQNAVAIGRADEPSLADDLRDIQADAELAISSGDTSVALVLDTYLEVLETYADGIRAYVDVVEMDHLPNFFEGERAPVDMVRMSLLGLFERALRANAREIAFEIVRFPADLVTQAVGWRAPAYFELLGAYPQYYWLANQGSVSVETRERLAPRCWTHPVELLDLYLPALARTATDDALVMIGRAEEAAHRVMFDVLRSTIRFRDYQNFREGLRRWRRADR